MSSQLRKIISKLIYMSVVTVLILSVSVQAFAYEGIGRVTGGTVNVRTGAGTNYSIITTVSKGAEYNIVSLGETWSKIELSDGTVGYIINDYLSKEDKTGTVTGSAVNVRKAPGTDSEIIGLVYRGQTLPVIGKAEGWVNIKYNDVTGWVSADYISMAVGEAVEEANKIANISKAQEIVNEAMKHVGKPYVYGANGPSAFDCSGFTSYVYKQFGYNLNRTAAGQNSNGTYVSRENLQVGDIVLFGNSYINHAGIYIGNDKFVHANNAQTGVIVTTISDSPYYSSRFVCGRRIV